MHLIDDDGKEKGISRAQWVSTAIDAYLHQDEVQSGADLEQMHRELDQARTEREQTWRESVQLRSKAEHLQREVNQTRQETAKAKEGAF